MEDSAIGHAAQLRRALPLKREAEQERLLRISEVEHLCGLKKSSLYAAMAAREFPASVALSGKAVGWKLSEVMRWIDQRPLSSGAGK